MAIRPFEKVSTQNAELSKVQDSMERTINSMRQSQGRLGQPRKPTVSPHSAGLGELLLLSGEAAWTISLPRAEQGKVGQTVTLVEIAGGTSTITLDPGNATVNGSTTHSYSGAYSVRQYMVVAEGAWVRTL